MGNETRKASARRVRAGTFERIFVGRGIDVGCGDDPVTADCVRWDREQGDAQELPGLEPEQFDRVYSGHCLEDLPEDHLLRVKTCDDGYDYNGAVWDRTHGPAEAALEACVRKLASAAHGSPAAGGDAR